MAKRARIHSRDIQPQIAAPQGLFAAARVQRFDWPANYPTTAVDELARKLHVGTTQETPDVTVTVEAFDVSHDTFSYLTGYTPASFPASGVSITNFQNVDVLGKIRDSATSNVLSTLYVKRGVVTAMDASFGVTANSTVTYTVGSNSKKEFKNPVKYDKFAAYAGSGTLTLTATPQWLPLTSGYTINGYSTAANGSTRSLDEGIDYTVTGTTLTPLTASAGDVIWVTYTSASSETFQALNDYAPAAIQGKYVPLTIAVQNIPRAQSATIRAAMNAERILEMGGLGKPVGYEVGVPNVTGDVTVLKTDTELINILSGQPTTSLEGDLEYQTGTIPLKIQLKDPANPSRVVLTYYVPSIAITSESDASTVNQSVQQTFAWESKTGELIVCSGVGPY